MDMVKFLSQTLIVLPPVLLALTFHEWAHAWSANRLGDPTARLQGRLSLNPLVHLDPIGTLVLLLTRLIGWAKPVPVDTRYLRNPKRDLFWIASAGPIANLTLAFLLGIIMRLGGPARFLNAYHSFRMGIPLQGTAETLSAMVCLCFIINIVLAWFNMIPIPPLDGSKVVMRFLSPEATVAYLQFSRYSFLILLLLFLVPAFWGVLWSILGPPVALTGYLFGGIRLF